MNPTYCIWHLPYSGCELCDAETRTRVAHTELQGAAVLGQPVGFGAGGGSDGGHGSGRTLPRNLDRGPQQIDLFPVYILHVVLSGARKHGGSEQNILNPETCFPTAYKRESKNCGRKTN